jgi:ribose transport system substrate-binding protein
LKAEQELKGVQVIWKGPPREDDRDGQISVIENFTNQGVTGMAVAALDETALLKPIQAAMQAGVWVVMMDSGIQGEPGKDYVSFVATDNVEGGRKAAHRMGEVLTGKGKIIVLRYQVGSDSTTDREEGFLAETKKLFPEIEILSSDQYAGATTESAFAKMENLLARFRDVDGIFAPCEPAVFGALRALQGAGLAGKVKVIGFDRSDKLTAALKAGEVHGLVLQDPMKIGYLAVKTIVDYLNGEPVVTRVDTGSTVVTPENMNEPAMQELLNPPIERYVR